MKTKQDLRILRIVALVIFIGLCIKAGAIIISFIVSLFINKIAAQDLYLGMNLSEIYNHDIWQYVYVMSFIIIIAVLKGYLFYLAYNILTKLNIDQPFSLVIANLITKISYIAILIGSLGYIANGYAKWLFNKGIGSSRLNFDSAEFLFIAGILFVIALVFKRGIEIQTENDLTI